MGQLSNRFQAKCDDVWYLIRQELADILDNLRDCFRRDDERG